jgi:predicted nuclease of restriction endonuclease-like RecB superfamily
MQNFKNHSRYYPFHHFVITPLTLIYLGWTVINLVQSIKSSEGIAQQVYHLIGAMILFFLPLLARIYGLKNQDRIIRMEMRQRYFELTGKPFREKEKRLRLSQIIALRFASDEELLPLMERTMEENLRAKKIKQLIKNWQEDRRRV